MVNGRKSTIMNFSQSLCFLISFVSIAIAIRVDWNTNTGPIIPPTTTVPPVPRLPYRDPAPVWENQAGDIPNPNPYQYVLPPPSRPKPPTDNYLRAPLRPFNYQGQNVPPLPLPAPPANYGQIIRSYPNNVANENIQTVPTLAVHYVPNVGFKYDAVVPAPTSTNTAKLYYVKSDDYSQEKHTKWNGKYNPKSKKYKAYQKVKYTPQIYNVPADYLELPYEQQSQPFNQHVYITTTSNYVNPYYETQQTTTENYPKQYQVSNRQQQQPFTQLAREQRKIVPTRSEYQQQKDSYKNTSSNQNQYNKYSTKESNKGYYNKSKEQYSVNSLNSSNGGKSTR